MPCAGKPQALLPRAAETGWPTEPAMSGTTYLAPRGRPPQIRRRLYFLRRARRPEAGAPRRAKIRYCTFSGPNTRPQTPHPTDTARNRLREPRNGLRRSLPAPQGPARSNLMGGPEVGLDTPYNLQAPPEPGNYAHAVFGCLATP
ncbi:hypothetical protein NDU88_007365 [Pleurodeles waltl]|uniref:Uncharacterized protein n=1 Tax=Pleurodeles waltl TaxID=8319 RepID=A0AAV7UNL7_PLEWA|nr:hypothetical protein NDU88_007365 [Pleurodeles waltl]